MSHRRSFHDTGDLAPAGAASTTTAPGKSTVTARLARRADPLPRTASAADGARDGNGVAAGADSAVARAASSAGQPLPGDVRARFESSLGADLSGVRVHTGDESAQAAGAVGARAYTVGNDIHFNGGEYAPSDPFGMHLLAHEVAHTQQQAGAAPTRQHKVEVSTPGDAAEVDADRAADAMVTGAPAMVIVTAGGGIARTAAPATASAGPPAATYNQATQVGPNLDKTIDWNNPPQFYGLAGDKATTLRDQYKIHLREHLQSEKDIVALGAGYEPEAIVARLAQEEKEQHSAAALALADASSAVGDAAHAVGDAFGGLFGGSKAADHAGKDPKDPSAKKKSKAGWPGAVDIEACRKALWRSAQRAIADTLSTETSDARYKKKGGTTYCNVYGTDMVNAMGGYLPRVWYADPENKTKLPKADLEKVPKTELSANMIGAWLAKWGADFGWSPTADAKAAQEAANSGRVAIIQASKIDGVSAGHVGVIMAEGNGHEHTTGKSAKGEDSFQPLQSQAGASNFEYSDTAAPGGGISADWWKGAGMKDEPAGNFYIYKGGHKATAVADASDMGKIED
jgi:hypothetical protein